MRRHLYRPKESHLASDTARQSPPLSHTSPTVGSAAAPPTFACGCHKAVAPPRGARPLAGGAPKQHYASQLCFEHSSLDFLYAQATIY